ncbi:MAG: hypothetical protein Kow00128_24050 [Deltaproteobacteria bacterium]
MQAIGPSETGGDKWADPSTGAAGTLLILAANDRRVSPPQGADSGERKGRRSGPGRDRKP